MLDLQVAQAPTTSPNPAAPTSLGVTDVRGTMPTFGAAPVRRPPAPTQSHITSMSATGSDTVAAIGSGVAIGLVLLGGLVASFMAAGERGASEKLTGDVAALQQQFKSGPVADAFGRAQTVATQISTVRSFLADAKPWPEILKEVAGFLPGSVKLTNLSVAADGAVRLEGEAANPGDVATALAAIDGSSMFGPPTLESASLNESAEATATLFSISTKYQQPAAAAAVPSTQSPSDQLITTPDSSDSGPDASLGQDATLDPTSDSGGPDGQ